MACCQVIAEPSKEIAFGILESIVVWHNIIERACFGHMGVNNVQDHTHAGIVNCVD
ncbi:Uncharacterised protein [Mycobacteroides abscessus subsp. abscessus]|nr:Uncharacterised protein [Mycobacteroides abscessus subsp. abscessus]